MFPDEALTVRFPNASCLVTQLTSTEYDSTKWGHPMYSDRLINLRNLQSRLNELPFFPLQRTPQQRASSVCSKSDFRVCYPKMMTKPLFLADGSPTLILQYVLRRCYSDTLIPCLNDGLSAYWAAADAFGVSPSLIMRLVLHFLQSSAAVDKPIYGEPHRRKTLDQITKCLKWWNDPYNCGSNNRGSNIIEPSSCFWWALASVFVIEICIIDVNKGKFPLTEIYFRPNEILAPSRKEYSVLDQTTVCFLYGGGHYNAVGRQHQSNCKSVSRRPHQTHRNGQWFVHPTKPIINSLPDPIRRCVPLDTLPHSPSTGSTCWCHHYPTSSANNYDYVELVSDLASASSVHVSSCTSIPIVRKISSPPIVFCDPTPPSLTKGVFLWTNHRDVNGCGNTNQTFLDNLLRVNHDENFPPRVGFLNMLALKEHFKSVPSTPGIIFFIYLYNRGHQLDGNWRAVLFPNYYVHTKCRELVYQKLQSLNHDITTDPASPCPSTPQWWLGVKFLVVTRDTICVASIIAYFGSDSKSDSISSTDETQWFVLDRPHYDPRMVIVAAHDVFSMEPLPNEKECLVCGCDIDFQQIKAICAQSRYLSPPTTQMIYKCYTSRAVTPCMKAGLPIPLSTLGVAWIKELKCPCNAVFRQSRIYYLNSMNDEVPNYPQGLSISESLADNNHFDGALKRWALVLAITATMKKSSWTLHTKLDPSQSLILVKALFHKVGVYIARDLSCTFCGLSFVLDLKMPVYPEGIIDVNGNSDLIPLRRKPPLLAEMLSVEVTPPHSRIDSITGNFVGIVKCVSPVCSDGTDRTTFIPWPIFAFKNSEDKSILQSVGKGVLDLPYVRHPRSVPSDQWIPSLFRSRVSHIPDLRGKFFGMARCLTQALSLQIGWTDVAAEYFLTFASQVPSSFQLSIIFLFVYVLDRDLFTGHSVPGSIILLSCFICPFRLIFLRTIYPASHILCPLFRRNYFISIVIYYAPILNIIICHCYLNASY